MLREKTNNHTVHDLFKKKKKQQQQLLRSVFAHVAACIMSMCHRRERIELASSLYLPRRETNTRSRCLAGAEYY